MCRERGYDGARAGSRERWQRRAPRLRPVDRAGTVPGGISLKHGLRADATKWDRGHEESRGRREDIARRPGRDHEVARVRFELTTKGL